MFRIRSGGKSALLPANGLHVRKLPVEILK
jgi:hypothetical protein